MNRPLRIVAFGCGLAARDLHGPALRALPGVELVGLCDRDADRMTALAAAAGNEPLCSSEPERLLAEAKPDVALILTPPDSHERLTIEALEAGAHVLVEKPFAPSAAAAGRMEKAALQSGRLLSVVHNELFTPGMAALRERLAAGDVGDVSTVHYLTSSRNQRFVPDPWYFEARGGRMGETLPHALCILDELLGPLVVRHVEASHLGGAILPDWADSERADVDDLRVELASADGRLLGSIWYSMNSWVPTQVLVAGSDGHLLAYPFGDVSEHRVEPPPMRESIQALRRRLARGLERRLRRLRRQRQRPRRIEDSSHYAQLAHFMAAVRGKATLRADAASACRVTTLWESIVDRIEATRTASSMPSRPRP